MGWLIRSLSRSCTIPVTFALLVVAWLALSVFPAAAAPGDTGPIQGSATAKQDPPGSCAGRPDTISFSATVSIQGGVLQITDPGGDASGAINDTGTPPPHLTSPQGETYDVLSNLGTTLLLREVNGGCNFLTTIVLQQPLPPLVGGAAVPQATAASAPTSAVNVPGGVIVPQTSGGSSLTWVWIAGLASGFAVIGGGVFLLVRQPVDPRQPPLAAAAPDTLTLAGKTATQATARDCSKERRDVEAILARLQSLRDGFAKLPALSRRVEELKKLEDEAEERFDKSRDPTVGPFAYDPELRDEAIAAGNAREAAEAQVKEAEQKGVELRAETDNLDEALEDLAYCLGVDDRPGTDKMGRYDENTRLGLLERLGLVPAAPAVDDVPAPPLPPPEVPPGSRPGGSEEVM